MMGGKKYLFMFYVIIILLVVGFASSSLYNTVFAGDVQAQNITVGSSLQNDTFYFNVSSYVTIDDASFDVYGYDNAGSYLNDTTINFSITPMFYLQGQLENNNVTVNVFNDSTNNKSQSFGGGENYTYYINVHNESTVDFAEMDFDISISSSWINESSLVSGYTNPSAREYPSVTMADFNNDGKHEMILGYYLEARYWNGSSWVSNGSLESGLPSNTIWISDIVDIGNDGTYELIGFGSSALYSYYWGGSSWVSNSSLYSGLPVISDPFGGGVDISDFNNDGKHEMIISDTDGIHSAWYWDGNSWVSNSSLLDGLTNSSFFSAATGDFNGDGTHELIAGSDGGIQGAWYWGGNSWVSNNSLYSGLNGEVNSAPRFEIEDFNGDGNSELLVTNVDGTIYPDSIYPELIGFYYVSDTNMFLEIGTPDGTHEFNDSSGEATTTVDLSSEFNSALNSCENKYLNNCPIAILVHSSTEGTINISSFTINYTLNNPLDINSSLNTALSGCSLENSGHCQIPISVSASSQGVLEMSNINLSYVGGKITNLQTDKRAVFESNKSHKADELEASGTKEIYFANGTTPLSGNYVAIANLDYSGDVDIDFNGVNIDTDGSLKSVFGNTTGISQIINKSLLVPRTSETYVLVCPDAITLEETTKGCTNGVYLQDGSVSGNMTVSTTTLEGQNYWLISNVSGTGGETNVAPEGNLYITPDPISESNDATGNVNWTDANNDTANVTVTWKVDGSQVKQENFTDAESGVLIEALLSKVYYSSAQTISVTATINDGINGEVSATDSIVVGSSESSENTASFSSSGSAATSTDTSSSKSSCDIDLEDDEIILTSSDSLGEITLTNNDDVSWIPTYGFSDVDGYESIKGDLSITNSIETLLQGTTDSFGVGYSGDDVDDGRALLTLSSSNCEDLEVTILFNPENQPLQINQLFDDSLSLLDNLINIAIDDLADSLPFVKVWMVFALVFLILLAASQNAIERNNTTGKQLNVLIIFILLSFVSLVATLFLTVIVRAILT